MASSGEIFISRQASDNTKAMLSASPNPGASATAAPRSMSWRAGT
jgi:hypothetical protein